MLPKESINVSDSDITIYDADNNKVKLQSGIYDQSEAFNCSRVISWPRIKINWLYRFPVEKGKNMKCSMNEKPIALIKIQAFKICGGFFSV